MQNAQDRDRLAFNSVGCNIRRSRDDQLAGSFDPARTPDLGRLPELRSYRRSGWRRGGLSASRSDLSKLALFQFRLIGHDDVRGGGLAGNRRLCDLIGSSRPVGPAVQTSAQSGRAGTPMEDDPELRRSGTRSSTQPLFSRDAGQTKQPRNQLERCGRCGTGRCEEIEFLRCERSVAGKHRARMPPRRLLRPRWTFPIKNKSLINQQFQFFHILQTKQPRNQLGTIAAVVFSKG